MKANRPGPAAPASEPPMDMGRRRFLRSAAAAAAAAALGTVRAGRAAAVEPDVVATGGAPEARGANADVAALRGTDPNRLGAFRLGREIHRNPLRSAEDAKGIRVEGEALMSFPNGRLRLENRLDASLKQKSNFVAWFDLRLPADFAAGWDFRAVREPGLCMVFFAARARTGGDIFDAGLAPRNGDYAQYHHGDIDTFHLSYFRRSKPGERAFHVCNLHKSHGFHLAAEGPDPLPSVADAKPPYRIDLVKCGPDVAFFIDRMPILAWRDDGCEYGPVLGAGRFGFRQMAPLQGEYENLVVREVTREGGA